MERVFVAGIGMTPFGRHLAGIGQLASRAVVDALADAGLTVEEVDAVFFANAVGGALFGQEMIRGQVWLAETGLLGKPIYNVENACASSSTALNLARSAVGSGVAEVAVVVGAEKLTHPDRAKALAALATAVDVTQVDRLNSILAETLGRETSGSLFMDVYAHMAKEFSFATDATPRDFAAVVVKSRAYAALNPRAQFRDLVDVDQVLNSRSISPPLTLLMCSPIGDGAAAVVICSQAVAGRLDVPAVEILASVVASGGDPSGIPPGRRAALAAFETAGLGAEDFDLVELHDGAAPAELILYEELGLCKPGDASGLIRSGATGLGGRLPVNTSGGLLSKGHPVGATGCAQVVELTEQLRGRAGDRQVPGARVAMAENGGGYMHPDQAVACVTIIARAEV